jgi:S1-C subfamily serine protease
LDAAAATTAVLTPPSPTTLVLPTVAARQAPLTPEEAKAVALYRSAEAGVVWVSSLTTRPDAFTQAPLEMPAGAGSGIVWDREGHVVTNAHVVRGAAAVRVRFLGGAEYDARVVGTDPDRDVAVLQVMGVPPAEKAGLFKPLPLGTSTGLQVGQRIYALGNPFGLERSFNTGILSGLGREVPSGVTARPMNGMLQIEAPINPGNSGGAALNSAGELVGMPTAIYSASGTSAGVGFAVPVDVVASSANSLIRTGKVVRPMLGISLAPEPAAESLGVKGVLILGVSPDGAAASAGLRATSRDEYGRPVFGDIIRGFNGASVESPSDLYRQLDKLAPGDEVAVKVLRGGSGEETVTVKLQASA